ncbi:MAG: alpha-amylase family glycosyl hydrolase [Chlamydia sp.]
MNCIVSKSYGRPYPLGEFSLSIEEYIWNFAIFSKKILTHVILQDIDRQNSPLLIPLDPEQNRTGDIWHIEIAATSENFFWCWSTCDEGQIQYIQDPYAKLFDSGNIWGMNNWKRAENTAPYPLATTFNWNKFYTENEKILPIKHESKIIYEMHIRGYTKDSSSNSISNGTFLGALEKLEHLYQMGITVIELLPIFEFDESEWDRCDPISKKQLCNYWGYSPLSFFSPHGRYFSDSNPRTWPYELRNFIDKCHEYGMQVILDVVFNHTGEGNENGPSYSWKSAGKEIYYIIDENNNYHNYSGCGNTFNANNPIAADMIIQALRHWVLAYNIDGFRFDLASALTRNQRGIPLKEGHVLERISEDPILSHKILITEPWDAVGLYQTGTLHTLNQKKQSLFLEWNDRFRDDVRSFINGFTGSSGKFASRMCGSEDLYFSAETPSTSINFITSHDGFTLKDLVSFNEKKNEPNGEENRDGSHSNLSWNCGVEGRSSCKKIDRLRQQQMQNYLAALILSYGTPMILSGDEYGHSKEGNNNSWCQDNEINWFSWNVLQKEPSLSQYIRHLISIRSSSSLFAQHHFLTPSDVQWHGKNPFCPDWSESSRLVAYTLSHHKTEEALYIAFYSGNIPQEIEVPLEPFNGSWYIYVNSSKDMNTILFKKRALPKLLSNKVELTPYSTLILGNSNRIGRNKKT